MINLLAADQLPPLQGGQLLSTTFNAIPVILILGALALYLWGVRRVGHLHPRHPWSSGKTAAFIGGLVTTAISVFSFIGVYQQELFWDHMVQHLLLIMVAAPLFAISSPVKLMWSATAGEAHARLTAVLRTRTARILGHPGVAFVAYAVLIPITHLTVWYNYTLEHPAIDDIEHLIFLGLGYMFWRQIFGDDPNCYRLHPALKFGYLFLAIPIDTFTGLSLDQQVHELFPAYLTFHRTWGPSLVADLHIGGVLMWVAGDTLMLWPMIPAALGWMHLEERKAVRIDRQLDAADEADAVELARFLAGPPPDQVELS
jgi:cytochrome c oxidase assembly factor CtaG